jgi:glutamate/tyrosine decarboxylase-like PLP-dependent enzyme
MLGRAGLAGMIERCCDLAAELVDRMGRLSGVEILAAPIINQGLVRFIDANSDHDARTEEVIRRVNASGEAWFGPTTWRGMRVMRVSVCSHLTTSNDIDRAIAAVEMALASGE